MENLYKCRTCLAVGNEREIGTLLTKVLPNSSTSFRDVLLQIVPQMETTLSDCDRICLACKKMLKTILKFIEQCLDVEDKLTEDLGDKLEDEAVAVLPVEALETADLEGNAEIVENIEIVVEEDLQQFFQKDKSDGDTGSCPDSPMVGHDHAYIKSEMEEGEVCFDEINQVKDPDIPITIPDTPYLGNREFCEDDKEVYGNLTESNDGSQFSLNNDENADLERQMSQGSPISTDSVYIKEEMMEDYDEESREVDSSDMAGSTHFKFTEGESSICEVCGKGFKNAIMLSKHLTIHEDRQVQCPTCPKIFKSELYLNRHIQLVHEPDNLGLRYLCVECDKLFKNKCALNAHYKLKHLKLEPFKCEICLETFGRADYLKKHLNQHVTQQDKCKKSRSKVPGKFIRFKNTDDPIPCKICGKYYNGIHKLKVHLQTHVVVKRYACDYCDLTYKRWPSLKRHEKTHLEADGKFHRCNVCWKRLPTKEDLQIHMTQHGNPRYRCHICNEQFHRKYLFDNHFLLQHATPEDLEISKKEIIYDTLLELASQP